MSERLWKKDLSVDQLNAFCAGTIHDSLGIRYTEIGGDFIAGEMPVDARTRQPFGLLHGGASVVLAESLGSIASYLAYAGDDHAAYGIEVNANHVKAARDGKVTGRATAIHLGQSLHVWEIRISDGGGALTCVARLTVMVRERKARPT